MDRSIGLLLIGLLFGAGAGFVFAAGNGITLDGHDHSAHGHGAAVAANGHSHLHDEFVSIPSGPDAPTLDIDLTPDPVAGWNLHVKTSRFEFAPHSASRDHVPGQGHAHVYVNGRKIARLYGPWMHLASLPDGPATVRVTLSTNDHRALAVDQTPVAASITIGAN